MTDAVEVTINGVTILTLPPSVVESVGNDFVVSVLHRKVTVEARLLIEKQAAYGPANIANPPSGITPQAALLVRINDKVQRLGNLLFGDVSKPVGSESRDDSWPDGANYFTIGGMVDVDGTWPTLGKGKA
jgi:hypothetical protein